MDDDYAGAAVGLLFLIGAALTVIFGVIWVIVRLVKNIVWVFISFWPWLLVAGVIIGAAAWWFIPLWMEREGLCHRQQRDHS